MGVGGGSRTERVSRATRRLACGGFLNKRDRDGAV